MGARKAYPMGAAIAAAFVMVAGPPVALIGAQWVGAFLGGGVVWGDCSTDDECSRTPRCLNEIGCDGGPEGGR